MIEHHLPSRRRTRLAAALAALTLAAGCGSSDPGSTDDADSPPPSSTPTSVETEPATETETVEATPIDGTWTTPTLAPADFRRVLAAHGLGAHADVFLSDFGGSVDLTLEVGGGFWTLSTSIEGGPTSLADRGSFQMQGKRVLVRPNSGGENLFRWRLADGELALALVSTTEPPYEGVPAETYQRGLYTTSPFRSAS